MMRNCLFVLALLAACSPAPPQAPETAATTAEAPQSDPNTAALGAASQTGAWIFYTQAGVTAAAFGPPESESLLTISCEMPSGKLSVSYEQELAPDQDTTLRIITPLQMLDLPARSFNEGLPNVTADVPASAAEKAALISMLGAPTDRFAVDVNGEINVFPWDDAISQVLLACR